MICPTITSKSMRNTAAKKEDSMNNNALSHVAVALIIKDQQVLLGLRPPEAHQGGLWEFPGGKLEAGESVEQALYREIKEELSIHIKAAQPFMKIHHDYGDKKVLLDIYQVTDFCGEVKGAEGQEIKWQPVKELNVEEFPQANRAIIYALQCSSQYLITGKFISPEEFNVKLERSLQQSVKVVQLRCKSVDNAMYKQLAKQAARLCQQYHAPLLLNTSVEIFNELSAYAQGLHLSSGRLFDYESRPVSLDKILSASCHSSAEIQQAKKLQADIVLISPVKETSSHPGVKGIGWEAFANLAASFNGPAYALGGMQDSDIDDARMAGGQGVAAISGFWEA